MSPAEARGPSGLDRKLTHLRVRKIVEVSPATPKLSKDLAVSDRGTPESFESSWDDAGKPVCASSAGVMYRPGTIGLAQEWFTRGLSRQVSGRCTQTLTHLSLDQCLKILDVHRGVHFVFIYAVGGDDCDPHDVRVRV